MFSTVVVLGFFFASGMGMNFPEPESLPRLFGIDASPNGDGHSIRPISA